MCSCVPTCRTLLHWPNSFQSDLEWKFGNHPCHHCQMPALEAASSRASHYYFHYYFLSPASVSINLPRLPVMCLWRSDFHHSQLPCGAAVTPEGILSSVNREVYQTSHSTVGDVQWSSVASTDSTDQSGLPDDAAFAPGPKRPPQLE